jgi:group I intron endonuclease
MSYTVYKHTSPSGKVYIGITRQKPEARWGRDGTGYKHSPHLLAAIKKYGWDAFQHDILAVGLTKEAACAMEVRLIAEYDSTNPDKGYNADLGGCAPGRMSAATRKKVSEAQRGAKHHYFGKHLSEEHRQRLGEAHRGKKYAPRTTEHCQHLSDANRGKHPSAETREKLSKAKKKPVRCIDTGIVYASVADAAADVPCAATNVCQVCKGKLKSVKGLRFKYADEEVIS